MFYWNYLALPLAYLLGAIPSGVLIGKLYGVDILQIGSGNPGATNAWRSISPRAGVLVFSADFLKGLVACAIAYLISAQDAWLIAGAALAALLGHNFSIFLKGRGGKGSAIGVGILWFISPLVGLVSVLLVVLIIAISGYVSLASLIASLFIPLLFYFLGLPLPYLLLSLLAMFIIWLKHVPNIKRLLKGAEKRFNNKRED